MIGSMVNMVSSQTARHMAENEMIFREYNERVQRGLDELTEMAKEQGERHNHYKDDAPLHFYCECSNENCQTRIMLTPSVYADIHQHRQRFVVVKGHDIPEVESIVSTGPEYDVVEKISELPASATGLHDTSTDEG